MAQPQQVFMRGTPLKSDTTPENVKGTPLKGYLDPQPFIPAGMTPASVLKFPPMNSISEYVIADLIGTNGGKATKLGGIAYPIILGDPENTTNEYVDAQGVKGSYETVELDCAIAVVDFNPHVVLTNIQGLKQTIKEFISSGDNDITITGIYNDTPGVAPIDFIKNLSDMFNAPVPIPVTHYYLNELGIYYIVIMPGTQMGQEQGRYATQTFTIHAISDVPMDKMLP